MHLWAPPLHRAAAAAAREAGLGSRGGQRFRKGGGGLSLRMALLALLSSGPMTGYDVGKQFSASVGHVWHAPDSQIYPEMRKLHAEGLLSAKPVPWGSRGATKTEYALTSAGENALREWQDQPFQYVRDRDPARLKAAYFEWAPPGAAARQLRAHVAHHEEQRLQALRVIEELQERTQPTPVPGSR